MLVDHFTRKKTKKSSVICDYLKYGGSPAGEQDTNLFYQISVERHSAFRVVFGLFRSDLVGFKRQTRSCCSSGAMRQRSYIGLDIPPYNPDISNASYLLE